MRETRKVSGEKPSDNELAMMAGKESSNSLDSYSEYGVGASLLAKLDRLDDEWLVYTGSNINLSGMEVKIHAEQLALFNFLLDYQEQGSKFVIPSINKVVVVTSDNDTSLICGHCLQVYHGACEYLGTDPEDVKYCGASIVDTANNWKWRRFNLSELLKETYVTRKE